MYVYARYLSKHQREKKKVEVKRQIKIKVYKDKLRVTEKSLDERKLATIQC